MKNSRLKHALWLVIRLVWLLEIACFLLGLTSCAHTGGKVYVRATQDGKTFRPYLEAGGEIDFFPK